MGPPKPPGVPLYPEEVIMSWALTIDNLQDMLILPLNKLEDISTDNPEYEHDAQLAFAMAKQAGLVSATISGGRTPSPYGGPATVVIAVSGFDSTAIGHAVPQDGRDFRAAMTSTVLCGPDEEENEEDY